MLEFKMATACIFVAGPLPNERIMNQKRFRLLLLLLSWDYCWWFPWALLIADSTFTSSDLLLPWLALVKQRWSHSAGCTQWTTFWACKHQPGSCCCFKIQDHNKVCGVLSEKIDCICWWKMKLIVVDIMSWSYQSTTKRHLPIIEKEDRNNAWIFKINHKKFLCSCNLEMDWREAVGCW